MHKFTIHGNWIKVPFLKSGAYQSVRIEAITGLQLWHIDKDYGGNIDIFYGETEAQRCRVYYNKSERKELEEDIHCLETLLGLPLSILKWGD
jgi:hypothetical protein